MGGECLHDSVVNGSVGKNMELTSDPARLQQMQNDEAKWKLLYPNTAIPDRFHYRSVHEYAFLNEGALAGAPDADQEDVVINEEQTKNNEERFHRMRNDEAKWKRLYPHTAIPERFHYRSRDEYAFFDHGVLVEVVPGQLKRKPEDISPIPAAVLPAVKLARQGEELTSTSTKEGSSDDAQNGSAAGSSTDPVDVAKVSSPVPIQQKVGTDSRAGSSGDVQIENADDGAAHSDDDMDTGPIVIARDPEELSHYASIDGQINLEGSLDFNHFTEIILEQYSGNFQREYEMEYSVDIRTTGKKLALEDRNVFPFLVTDIYMRFKPDKILRVCDLFRDRLGEEQKVYGEVCRKLAVLKPPGHFWWLQRLWYRKAFQSLFDRAFENDSFFDWRDRHNHEWSQYDADDIDELFDASDVIDFKNSFSSFANFPLHELAYSNLEKLVQTYPIDRGTENNKFSLRAILQMVCLRCQISVDFSNYPKQLSIQDQMRQNLSILKNRILKPPDVARRAEGLVLAIVRLRSEFRNAVHSRFPGAVSWNMVSDSVIQQLGNFGQRDLSKCAKCYSKNQSYFSKGFSIGTVQCSNQFPNDIILTLGLRPDTILRMMLYVGFWPCDISARWRLIVQDVAQVQDQTQMFAIQNSLDVPKAKTPPCFLHTLKGEQFNSLSWMYVREGRTLNGVSTTNLVKPTFKTTHTERQRVRGIPGRGPVAAPCALEIEVTRNFSTVRGGILADQIGYGKTACMIALIAQTRVQDDIKSTFSAQEKTLLKKYIFTNATLIVTPANLFNQWLEEFKKFVDKSKLNLKILAIATHTNMKKYKMKDFVEADVVLVSFRFFFSMAYYKYFDAQVGGCAGYAQHDRGSFTKRIIQCRRRTSKLLRGNRQHLLGQKALIEAFYWKRVVFDEFHEVVKTEADIWKLQSMLSFYGLRHLQGRYRWGLTATPLLDSAEDVAKMASLFQIFLPNDRKESQRFLDEFARANKWDVSTIPLEEKMIKQKSEGDEELLRFCSHFSPDGTAVSADNALEKAVTNSKAQKERTANELKILQKQLIDLEKQKSLRPKFHAFCQNLPHESSIKLFVHSTSSQLLLMMGSWEEGAVYPVHQETIFTNRLAGIRMCLPGCLNCNECLRKGGMENDNFITATIENQQQLIKSDETKLGRMESSLRYLNNIIKTLCEAKDVTECSVCMEDMQPEDTVLTKCGHPFCNDCIVEALAVNPRCPQCRTPTTFQQCTHVRNMNLFIASQPKQVEKVLTDEDQKREERRTKVGSKILAIVELIEKLRVDKPGEKIIIFIQWDKIRDSLISAIESVAGFQPLVLKGDVHKRKRDISNFQHGSRQEDQVLVLSMEESATGMNLVCANHCILVHPMCGDHKYATDCEKQAIGRVRRQGQTKTCYLYRFFTEGTIEEDLMKKHSEELQNPAPAAGGQ
eukprot:gene403-709_t